MSDPDEESITVTTSRINVINCTSKLVCVQYPGNVINVDKALECLGGINNIEFATSTSKRNLELHFHPKNYYNKPCPADRDIKPNLLMKLKVRKAVKDGKPVNSEVDIIDYDVVGITALNFRFNKLTDFQYLPMVPKEEVELETDLEYVYNKIIPDEIPNLEFLLRADIENMPYYLPPPSFSKYSSSKNQLYFERSKFYEGRFTPQYYKKFKEQELQQKLYRKDKGKNQVSHSAYFCYFEDEIPQGPPKSCLNSIASKYISHGAVEKLKALFEKRPIWSKMGLIYHTDISTDEIKHILPTIAYYYISGPWRVMWIKFGYDPKLDPSSRIYQTFDYRVRAKAGLKMKVKAKRSYACNIMFADKNQPKFSLNDENCMKSSRRNLQENVVLLKPGLIPSARQMFYQYSVKARSISENDDDDDGEMIQMLTMTVYKNKNYEEEKEHAFKICNYHSIFYDLKKFCDVQLPEVEVMLLRLPPVLPGTQCNKKRGWLPSGFTEQCRELANRYIYNQVKKELHERKDDAEELVDFNIEKLVHSEPEELYEISDTSSSSSDSEEDAPTNKKDVDSETEIDLETVEEVNQIVSMSLKQEHHVPPDPKPGPSSML